MKILIDLGNNLLGNALQMLLSAEEEKFEVSIATDERTEDFPEPDFIITDYFALRRQDTNPFQQSRVLLIDHGMSEDEMSSLLLSYRIDGVLATTTDLIMLDKALQAVNNGQIWIDNSKIKALVRHAENSKGLCKDGELTKKEREIAAYVSRGLTNKEIAASLFISVQTVKSHISNIFRKSNISRRSQLVQLAMKLGLPEQG